MEFLLWLGLMLIIALIAAPLMYFQHQKEIERGEKPTLEFLRGGSTGTNEQAMGWLALALVSMVVVAVCGFVALNFSTGTSGASAGPTSAGSAPGWKPASGRINPGVTIYTQDHQPFGVVQVQVTRDSDGDEAVLLRLPDGRPFHLKRRAIRDNPTVWLVQE